jgi:hypothetical protein
MKIKIGFLAFFVIFALLFLSCDAFLDWWNEDNNENNNNGNGANTGIIGPLLQTKWGQGNPFNSMLPEGHRSFCGLVTMSQIMKFHNHPVRGSGQSEAYTMRNEVLIPSVNFGATNYEWGNMLYTYTSSATEQNRNAVATLYYHAGVARGRDFISGVDRNNFSYALTTFFGYDRSIQRLERRFYDDETWEAIIREQLDSGLPVQYVGYEPGDNHAFIIDGYDSNGKFHINWGWAGSHDGWYFLNNFNYSGERRWNDNQYIHINIMPDRGGVPLPYEMALNSFTANKTTIPQNELFTVSAQVRNLGTLSTFPGGQIGTALVNNNGSIAAIIRIVNFNELNPLSNRTSTINSFVPDNVEPGQYQLRMVIRPTDGEWKIITKSAIDNSIPNAINFTVNPYAGVIPGGGYGQALTSFTPSKTSVSQNEPFTISYSFVNMNSTAFPGGNIEAVLMSNNGNIMETIGRGTTGGRGPGLTTGVGNINCTVPFTIDPGQYKLRIIIRPTGVEEWRIATLSTADVLNSIDFTVE